MDELRFDGKRAVVTGGGRGFGSSHAELLASRGAKVVVADNGVDLDGSGSSPEPAEAVAARINDAGGDAIAVFADVADEDDARRIVQTALDAWGGLDILVNNAGISDPDWFAEETLERHRRMLDVHHFGTVMVAQQAWAPLQRSRGCIVNTTSEAIVGRVPKHIAYAAAKGAVFAFTRALALDGRRHGIRVNAVAPSGTTRMSDASALSRYFDLPPETFDRDALAGRKKEHASAAVGFLAHDSCTLTGETIICGGGRAMRMAVVASRGIDTGGDIFPEDLAAHVDQLMALEGASRLGLEAEGR